MSETALGGLTMAGLQALTDERTFARGEEYFKLGQVFWLAETPDGYCAVVQGQRAYHVTLQVTPDGIHSRCDCPAAAANDWCKHAVAVALTVTFALAVAFALVVVSAADAAFGAVAAVRVARAVNFAGAAFERFWASDAATLARARCGRASPDACALAGLSVLAEAGSARSAPASSSN